MPRATPISSQACFIEESTAGTPPADDLDAMRRAWGERFGLVEVG